MHKHTEILNNLDEILTAKSADYGDSFEQTFAEFGIISAIIRMTDKLNRIKTLTAYGTIPKVVDESLKDTLMDLAGYAVKTISALELLEEEKLNG